VTFLLHDLLSEAAKAAADREAVRCRGRLLTYAELDEASNGVAQALIAGGVRPGDRVGIDLPKRVETVACVYGILKAGAAYVPLDPKGPPRRAALVASDCTVRAVVTTPSRARDLEEALREQGHRPQTLLLLDDGSADERADGPDVITYEQAAASGAKDPQIPTIESDLAYILYTSGSTGTPKGVMLTHRNAMTFIEWCARRIGVGPEDRVSNHAPLHFDLSIFDIYLTALGRATLVLVPEDEAYMAASLCRLIQEERISLWYSVPSALMMLSRLRPDPRALASLRTVVFAGEVYPTAHLRELRELVPHAVLWNLYGPTETNVCTYYQVKELPEDDRTIPIGRACENTEVFAIREDGAVSGVGEEGELCVRGPTVMKGYWKRAERTAEILVTDPRSGSLGDPVYRTGDIVRLRQDGDYDFLGRRDHQIKSRGYRIELGEIEAALNAHPSVLVGVAVAVPHDEWGTEVIAFVALRDGEVLSEKDLRRHVARRLPRYMVPTQLEIVDELPRTSTGKIDRQRLIQDVGTGSSAPA